MTVSAPIVAVPATCVLPKPAFVQNRTARFHPQAACSGGYELLAVAHHVDLVASSLNRDKRIIDFPSPLPASAP
jgi:hypothetical protein